MTQHNARLIAAAPKMLAALKNAEQVLSVLIGMYGDSGAGLILKEIQNALQEAEHKDV